MRFFSDNAAAAHPKVIEAIAASNRLDTAYDGDEWSQRLDGAFSDLFETEVRALWVTTGTAANCLALAALCPPYGGDPLPPRRAYRGRRGGRSRLLHRRRQADAARWRRREDHAGCGRGGLRPHPQRRPPGPAGSALDHQRHRIRPRLSRRRGRSARRTGEGSAASRFHMDGARFANALATTGESPADVTWRAGVDALSLRLRQEWRPQCRGADPVQDRACRRGRGAPQARRAFAVEGPDAGRADPRDARRRVVARQCPRRQCRCAERSPSAAPHRLVYPVEANEIFLKRQRGRGRASAQRRASTSTTGDRGRSASSPAGTSRAKQSIGSPRRSRAVTAISEAYQLRARLIGPGPTDPLLQRSMKPSDLAEAELSEGHSERPGSVVIPFIIFTAIWGSTWIVIRGQLGTVPPQWSVTYRFVDRRRRDGAHSRDGKATSCDIGRQGPDRRCVPRLHPILRELQRRLSRRTAHHVGRRRDRVRVAADSRRACWRGRCWASGRAGVSRGARWSRSPESPCCSSTKSAQHPADRSQIAAGIGLTLVGMLGAAIANVCPGAARDPRSSRCSRCWPGRWPLAP